MVIDMFNDRDIESLALRIIQGKEVDMPDWIDKLPESERLSKT